MGNVPALRLRWNLLGNQKFPVLVPIGTAFRIRVFGKFFDRSHLTCSNF